MRQGYDNQLLIDQGKLIGINLGADFTAEHEWGIKEIQAALGLDSSKMGIKARKVRKAPTSGCAQLNWVTTEEFVGFCLMTSYTGKINLGYLEREVRFLSNQTLWTGWDSRSFGAFAKVNDTGTIERLREIYDNFMKKNIVVWHGGGGVFQNAGLCLGILDRMPKETAELWYQADKKRNEAQQYMEDSGIEKILKDAGKEYFALSPRKMDNGTIKFWLNPMEQRKYDFGWYTLEELKLWARDQGPVMLKGKR